jgi:bacterioferritin
LRSAAGTVEFPVAQIAPLTAKRTVLPRGNAERTSALTCIVIDELRNAGYLENPPEELAALIAPEEDVEVQELAAALKLVQQLDPPRIGTGSLQECLLPASPPPARRHGRAPERHRRPPLPHPRRPAAASLSWTAGAHGKIYKERSGMQHASAAGRARCPRCRGTPIAVSRSLPPDQEPSMSSLPTPVLSDVHTLRARARRHIETGALTETYRADLDTVLKLLNAALATEIVCSLRYKRHYYTAKGLASAAVAAEFLEHAKEEEEHAGRFAERITQLGGEPDFSPDSLSRRSHAEYVEGHTLPEMIKEDLVAERIAIDSYRETVQYIGDADPTTRRLFEEVLAVEEQHADELLSLIQQLGEPLHAI